MHTLSRFAAVLAGILTFACLAPAQTWTQTGSGTYSWTDGANWSGGLVPNGDTAVAVFSDATAGAAKTVSVSGLPITLGQLQIDANQSNPLTISGGTIRLRDVSGGGNLNPISVGSYTSPVTHTISSAIDFDASNAPRAVVVGTNATLDLAGSFINSAGGTLLISGGGTTVLSGSNATFAAPLLPSGAGTVLVINGTVGSEVTVDTGATLTGSGTVNGPVTVNEGGTLSGNLNLASLTLGNGPLNYTADVGGTPASPVNDTVQISGALTAQPGTILNFTLMDDGTLVPGGTYTITLLDAGSISGLTAAQITAVAANFGFAGTPFATIDGAQGLVNLTFTVVPEPATALGIGAAGLGALWLRRRRAVARA